MRAERVTSVNVGTVLLLFTEICDGLQRTSSAPFSEGTLLLTKSVTAFFGDLSKTKMILDPSGKDIKIGCVKDTQTVTFRFVMER